MPLALYRKVLHQENKLLGDQLCNGSPNMLACYHGKFLPHFTFQTMVEETYRYIGLSP